MVTNSKKSVTVKVDLKAMKNLSKATQAVSELASASIMGLDIPCVSRATRRS